jgi:hypothetical protein
MTVTWRGHENKNYGIPNTWISKLCNYAEGSFKDILIKRKTEYNGATDSNMPYFLQHLSTS